MIPVTSTGTVRFPKSRADRPCRVNGNRGRTEPPVRRIEACQTRRFESGRRPAMAFACTICDETKFFSRLKQSCLTARSRRAPPLLGLDSFIDLGPGSSLAGAFLEANAKVPIWLDFIFCLRTGLTPSPTNGCKSAAFGPPSRPPSQGEYHDQSRRYSDVLLRQRVLCGSYSRGYNSACLTCARAAVHARCLQPPITNCLAPAAPLRSEHPLGALCTLPAGASAP
jgi:hypothetical protein